MFELVKRKEGFETKLQVLESPDSDKRAKSYTRTKIGSGIVIKKIEDLIREKEKMTNSLTNEHSLNESKRRTCSLKRTNERTLAN